MATSHGSPFPGTCHTDLSVENEDNKRTYPKSDPRSFEEPRGWWGVGETNKGKKAAKATRSKPRGQNYMAMA